MRRIEREPLAVPVGPTVPGWNPVRGGGAYSPEAGPTAPVCGAAGGGGGGAPPHTGAGAAWECEPPPEDLLGMIGIVDPSE